MEDDTCTDLYGFQLRLNMQQQAIRLQNDGISQRNESNWVSVAQQQQLPAEAKLKMLIRLGIPPTLRTFVWMEVSGAAAKKAAVGANYFSNMCLAGDSSTFLKDIDKDILHTFANHPWLEEPDGQAALRRVLAAYSVHNPEVGYCRSMNHIVALLLVALNRNQEAAFWLLAALVEDILQPDTYNSNLVGCQVEMKALDELIAQKLPRLSAHLNTLEADVSILATDWFLTLYAASMPSETVAWVWDALFCEGSKILFRTALAVLKTQEDALLAIDNAGELLMAVRQYTSTLHDREQLMQVAFDGIGSMPMAVIERCRHERSAEVAAAVRERQAMHNRQELRNTIVSKQRTTSSEAPVDEQLEGMRLNEYIGELSKQAGVLGKQAASNLKKGFASLKASAKELSVKAHEQIKRGSGTGSGSGQY